MRPTRATTWATWIAGVLLLTAGTASAASGLLNPNSCQGKNALEGGLHRGLASVSAEACRGCAESCSFDAAGLFVAPQSSGWTQLARDSRRYLNDIEAQTGLRVPANQRQLLADALRERQFTRLTPEQAALHRTEFNRVRPDLIRQWEQNTGQVWPRYTEEVLSRNGTVLRRVGDPFDAHHIIENVYGGPNQWWNMHPARFPGQHQGGIHRAGGVARELFE